MSTSLNSLSPELLVAIRNSVEERFESTVERLKDLVRIPGLAWDNADPSKLRQSAEAVAALARESGLSEVSIDSVARPDGKMGGPAVLARKPARAGAPTVLLYAHHDVQPTGDKSLWNSEPFEPEQQGERLYGRGAADDKAGVVAHFSAFSILQDLLGNDFDLGVTFFIEGEEEAGSPSFAAFLTEHRELLAADVIVIADSSNWKVGVPALTSSLRGLVDGVIEVQVLDHAVHSGMFGGPILDAPTQLMRLLATLHAEDGSVAVKGLHVAADPLVDYADEDFRADASVLDGLELSGSGSITSRLWAKPAVSIIGIDAPSVAESSNTLLATARAKISVRLAPGDNPESAMRALQAHFEQHAPRTAAVRFIPGEQGRPFQADLESPATQLMLGALEHAFDSTPVLSGMGGSIPFTADLKQAFPEAQILITGVEDPDSRAHSANESLHLGDFKKVIEAQAILLAGMNDGTLER